MNRSHIDRRINQHEIMRYNQMFPPISAGAFLDPSYRGPYVEVLESSSARSFG